MLLFTSYFYNLYAERHWISITDSVLCDVMKGLFFCFFLASVQMEFSSSDWATLLSNLTGCCSNNYGVEVSSSECSV